MSTICDPRAAVARRARRPVRALLRAVAGALVLAVAAVGQLRDLDADEYAVVKRLAAALRESDVATLVELTDFEARQAEGLLRGWSTRAWSELDELEQLALRQQTVEGWLADLPDFRASAFIWDVAGFADPDAGRGPVPDRRWAQVVLKSLTLDQLRDVLVMLTPDLGIVDVEFGAPYPEGRNPLGDDGLAPRQLLGGPDASIRWAPSVDDLEREEAVMLVRELRSAAADDERALLAEGLHRVPRAAVTALLLELDRLVDDPSVPLDELGRLDDVLERITGRPSSFLDAPTPGLDPAAARAHDRAEVDAWRRWHALHVASFAPRPIIDPIDPTFDERRDFDDGIDMPRWDALLRQRAAEAGGAPSSGSAAASGAGAARSPSGVGSSTGVGSARPVTGVGSATGVGSSAAPSATGVGSAAGEDRPRVVLREPVRDDATPARRADALTILWGEREVALAEVADSIPAPVRRALDEWAESIERLGLRPMLTGCAEHVVLGRASDAALVSAGRVLDRAFDLLDPLLPMASGRAPRATLAFVYDEQAVRDGFWPRLLDELVARRALLPEFAERERSDPGGFTARAVPLFVQPTWDMAGNASTGDDEFRLDNELAHKFAQCLLTQRCGQMPTGVLWAVGHLAEIGLFGTVYQFNRSGFVSTGDHFDWPRTARRVLEKRGGKRDFSLAGRLLAAADHEDLENAQIAWAVLDVLSRDHLPEFQELLLDLAELQQEADPGGAASAFRGDDARTRAVLSARLSRLDVDELVRSLERR